MAEASQISKVLNSLTEIVACGQCGTRLRFGDWECPHCGADLDSDLRHWAERLLDQLTDDPPPVMPEQRRGRA